MITSVQLLKKQIANTLRSEGEEVYVDYTGHGVSNKDTSEIYSVDLFIPRLNVAFDINDFKTHSTKGGVSHVKESYHYDKYCAFESAGIGLFILWEYYKEAFILDFILIKCGTLKVTKSFRFEKCDESQEHKCYMILSGDCNVGAISIVRHKSGLYATICLSDPTLDLKFVVDSFCMWIHEVEGIRNLKFGIEADLGWDVELGGESVLLYPEPLIYLKESLITKTALIEKGAILAYHKDIYDPSIMNVFYNSGLKTFDLQLS